MTSTGQVDPFLLFLLCICPHLGSPAIHESGGDMQTNNFRYGHSRKRQRFNWRRASGEVYINPFHLILKGGPKLAATSAGSCWAYTCVWARNLRVKVPEPCFCIQFHGSSLHSHKYSPFSALRLHFMKFLVISGECALNVNSNYYRNPAFAFLFLTICALFLQHLAIYAPIYARVLKQFSSTGTMVSPYSLPPPASPELNL